MKSILIMFLSLNAINAAAAPKANNSKIKLNDEFKLNYIAEYYGPDSFRPLGNDSYDVVIGDKECKGVQLDFGKDNHVSAAAEDEMERCFNFADDKADKD